jgi:molybdate transport system ATP-binding protein
MITTQSLALYVANSIDKEILISKILHNTLLGTLFPIAGKGLVFSKTILDGFIDEEFKHDHHFITTEANNTLASMSSGQQKKALLHYLLSQQPSYLILDEVFNNIDVQSRAEIIDLLQSYQNQVTLLQLTASADDIIPFVKQIIIVNNGYQISEPTTLAKVKEELLHLTNNAQIASPLPILKSVKDELPETLVELRNVSVAYEDKKIVHGINWQIKKGELWQLMGANGSGKTTLVAMIYGDNPKAFGKDITIMGIKKGSGERVWDLKKHIGYFSPAMLTRFYRMDSIEDMIISGLFDSIGLYTKPTIYQRNIAKQWIELLGLSAYTKQPFYRLSEGHQRIVMIARAMIKQPALLILDEPTAGLDDANIVKTTALVNYFAQNTNTAIVYISHRQEQGLHPQYNFQLEPSDNGSIGYVK